MTNKKKKESENTLAGWAEIIKQQGEQYDINNLNLSSKTYELELNQEAVALFHKLWGEAHNSPDYNKENWKRMQLVLDKLGIKV